jgi:transposase
MAYPQCATHRVDRLSASTASAPPPWPPVGRQQTAFLGARYARLGKKKALVALEHSILISVWHLLSEDVDDHDLGGDYFIHRDPERATRRAIAWRNQLGYTVALNPITAVTSNVT